MRKINRTADVRRFRFCYAKFYKGEFHERHRDQHAEHASVGGRRACAFRSVRVPRGAGSAWKDGRRFFALSGCAGGDVVVPGELDDSTVDVIQTNAFSSMNAITSLTLPDTLLLLRVYLKNSLRLHLGVFSAISASESLDLAPLNLRLPSLN